jgi:hypothetical protein
MNFSTVIFCIVSICIVLCAASLLQRFLNGRSSQSLCRLIACIAAAAGILLFFGARRDSDGLILFGPGAKSLIAPPAERAPLSLRLSVTTICFVIAAGFWFARNSKPTSNAPKA